MATIIAEYIKAVRGCALTDRGAFNRAVRGKDGSGYPTLTDEDVSKVYLAYLCLTADEEVE